MMGALLRFYAWPAVVLLLAIAGCDGRDSVDPPEAGERAAIVIDGITVPVFATAEEQLNYTRSWFAEKDSKRAALKAFIALYPRERELCGLASLELAYMRLGDDYRFAHENGYFDALASYNDILAEYVDFPGIMAKALWYKGWIFTDLLYDRQAGLAAYRRLVREHPHEHVLLLPAAPWVSLIYPGDDQGESAADIRPGSTWAALALMEIVKHADTSDAAWESFVLLWRDYRHDVATGFALRLVLRRRYHVEEALVMANRFMAESLSNVHLLSDIRREILAIQNDNRGESGARGHEN